MFVALAPFYILASSIVLLLLVTAFIRKHALISALSFAGLLLAFVSVLHHCSCAPSWAQSMLVLDKLGYFFIGVSLLSALFINVLSYYYFQKQQEQKEEYYILLNTAVLGTLVMLTAKHFISFFIGLELLSIALYVMIAYTRNNPKSTEAAIKYLTLAGASSAVMLFGMALIYAATGSMDIYALGNILQVSENLSFAIIGLALFIASIGFKLAWAPFHMWSPDVYQGSPAPVTAFIASVAKGGALLFFMRFLASTSIVTNHSVFILLAVFAVLSMFTGNLLAIQQKNLKRMLAFSSIAHLGYIIIALVSPGELGTNAALFYITTYFITTIAAFGVISAFTTDNEPDAIDYFKGFYYKNPLSAIVLATALLSLAGMPLTSGFVAKVYVAMAGADAKNWWLVWLLIINSAIGLYYYTKVVTLMFKKPEESVESSKLPVIISIVLAILLLLTIWFGVLPGGLLSIGGKLF